MFITEIVKHSASEISKTQNSPPVNSPFQQHQWKRSSSSVSRQSSSQSTPSTPHNVAPLLKDAVTSAVPTVKNYSAPENSFSLLQSCVLPCSNVSSPKNRMEEDISSIKKLVPSVQGDALVDKGVTRKEIEQKVSDTHMTVVGNSPQSGFNNVPSSSFPSPRLSPYLVSNNDDIACKTGILRGHQNTYGPFNFDPDLKHPINNSNSNVAHVSSVIPKVYSSTSLPTSTRHPLQQMAESDLGLQRHWPVQNAPPPFAVPSSPISFSQRFPSLSDPRSNSKVYMSRSANQIGSHGVSRPMGVTLAQQFYLHHTRPYRMGQNVVRSFPTPNIASSALPQLLVGIDNALLGPMVLAPRQTDTSPSSQGNCPTAGN